MLTGTARPILPRVSLVNTLLQLNGFKEGLLQMHGIVRVWWNLFAVGDARQEGRPLSEESLRSVAHLFAENNDAVNVAPICLCLPGSRTSFNAHVEEVCTVLS